MQGALCSLSFKWIVKMEDKKSKNVQTALILFSVVAVFFIGIFVKQIWFR